MIAVVVVTLLAYVVIASFSGAAIARRFKNRTVTERERTTLYRHSMIESWIAALILLGLSLVAGLSFDQLGLGAPSTTLYPINTFVAAVAIGGGACLLIVLAVQTIQLLRRPDDREQAWRQLTGGSAEAVGEPSAAANGQPASASEKPAGEPSAGDVVTRLMIPRSARERRLFCLLSVTAGICEEFVFRGVLFAVLVELFPGLNVYLVPVIAALVFAIPHLYQGIAGVGKTGAIGLVMGFVYAATGFLPAAMVLHAAVDLANVVIAPPPRDSEPTSDPES